MLIFTVELTNRTDRTRSNQLDFVTAANRTKIIRIFFCFLFKRIRSTLRSNRKDHLIRCEDHLIRFVKCLKTVSFTVGTSNFQFGLIFNFVHVHVLHNFRNSLGRKRSNQIFFFAFKLGLTHLLLPKRSYDEFLKLIELV